MRSKQRIIDILQTMNGRVVGSYIAQDCDLAAGHIEGGVGWLFMEDEYNRARRALNEIAITDGLHSPQTQEMAKEALHYFDNAVETVPFDHTAPL